MNKLLIIFISMVLVTPCYAEFGYKSGSGYNTGQVVQEESGHVIPYDDNVVNLGSATKEFNDLYIDGTAYIDAQQSESILATSGTLTLGGTGNTNNENLTLDFETTSNQVEIGTGTGVTSVDFNTINLETDRLDLSEGNITNVGDIALDSISSDASTTISITLGSDAGDDLLVDTNVLVVEGDNNRVGIGTTTPAETLEVVGNIKSTPSTGDGSLTIQDSVPTTTIYLNSNGESYLNGGNVAIGSNNPLDYTELDITGGIRYTEAQFVDEMWSGVSGEWATDVTTGSVAGTSRENGWYRLTTGATATNEESIDFDDITVCVNTQRPTFEIRLDLEEISDTEVEVGLKESEGVGTDDYIMLAFDPSAQATWYCEASSGGSATTDQGATADTNDILLRFEFTSDTAIEWFADGSSQGTISANVPTVALQPFIRIRTEANAAHYIDVDFVKIWQDRS